MSGSIAAVLDYLDKVDPEAAAVGARALWLPHALAEGALDLRPRGAHGRLPQMRAGRGRAMPGAAAARSSTTRAQDGEGFLDAAQNARLIASAERYYRIMYYGGAEVLEPARHAHVRDARAPARGARAASRRRWSGRTTPISATPATPRWARSASELNIGQLCRERFGDEAALIGFGTHTGTVAAATDWDGDDGGQARAAVASRQLRAALPRRRRAALPARSRAAARGAATAAARSRGWSASSA